MLYHRQNGGLSDSTGLAVYVPSQVDDINGLLYFLKYVYDISENDSIAALYYYKQAGCLNEELKEALALITDKEPKVLDIRPFKQFTKNQPETDEVGFKVPVSSELMNLVVDYQLEVSRYDEGKDVLTYYGRDNCLTLDGEGSLVSNFDGKWICLEGQPLSVEIISSSPAATDYRAHILYNGDEAWLELSWDRDTDEVHITGVRKVPTGIQGDVNYLNNTRSREEVEFGSKITPLYEQTDLSDNSTSNSRGRTVTFNKSGIDLRREALPSGTYLSAAVISDTRGDSYYSGVVASTMSGGTMSGWTFDSRFYGSDY